MLQNITREGYTSICKEVRRRCHSISSPTVMPIKNIALSAMVNRIMINNITMVRHCINNNRTDTSNNTLEVRNISKVPFLDISINNSSIMASSNNSTTITNKTTRLKRPSRNIFPKYSESFRGAVVLSCDFFLDIFLYVLS